MPWDSDIWLRCRDANPSARAIFVRHYSYRPYRDGRKPLKFVGPGQYVALITPHADALFVWRKFISGDDQQGVNCAVFRNEGGIRSRELITEASRIAWERWPGERLYTYVNPRKLSVRRWHGTKRPYCPWPPGRCFIEAGWRKCGVTKHNKLIILEMISDDTPIYVDEVEI
jgi:hypothetical protein